jgi:F-type H+-transporting ATPase subunit delta
MSTRFARPYAEAFLQSVPPGFDLEAFQAALEAVARAVQSSRELRAVLASPSVETEAKTRVLADLAEKAGVGELGKRFLSLILHHRRIAELPEIAAALREARDEGEGIVPARVTAAGELSASDRERMSSALSSALGRKVRASFAVDSKLMAGFVARVGSKVYDASALGAIERFKEEIDGN